MFGSSVHRRWHLCLLYDDACQLLNINFSNQQHLPVVDPVLLTLDGGLDGAPSMKTLGLSVSSECTSKADFLSDCSQK